MSEDFAFELDGDTLDLSDVHMTIDGVVMFPGGFMHPLTYRSLAGEEAYQALLAQPRVPSPYPDEEPKP